MQTESWNFLFNRDFGLSRAESGHKDGDEFDSNTFEFPRATPLTYLKKLQTTFPVIIRGQIQHASQNQKLHYS